MNKQALQAAFLRFGKIVLFGAIGGGLSTALTFLTNNPTYFGVYTVLATALIAALEKGIFFTPPSQ